MILKLEYHLSYKLLKLELGLKLKRRQRQRERKWCDEDRVVSLCFHGSGTLAWEMGTKNV